MEGGDPRFNDACREILRARGPLGRLSTGERLTIMRRHAGVTQAQVARGLKCCRRWVMLMETDRAPADDLAWYWEQ